MEWVDPLVRGCVALLVTGLVFGAARYRFRRKEDAGGPGDLGLD